jgi:ATP-dependent RNA helicase SUPV3L1/SUV3
MNDQSRIVAVLGPTNTGKTHYAIERMLGHRTGIIGLPLRLLAREVYDRIVGLRGPSVVALVTGEERIVPERTQYWVCTVEAMPEGMGTDFLAVDEIQLCADPERGHVFTDRLLRARGLHETLFLGSDTMRGTIAALVPKAQFVRRERFSTLSYVGSKKISRMKPRSAIVGFSVENVYAIAELIRRQKGGAAVVMGALSPRTRNAQVAMYQNGDVDYLVATDAIGMGLNLDIDHVAFSGTTKFDGRRMRPLQPNELAQIAGRAGRHMNDGTFGVTGEASPLAEEVVEAIENHQFMPVRRLQWRNAALDFGSVERLVGSLESAPKEELLVRAREADDLMALKALAESAEVRGRIRDARDVKLLWDVCRIPDFRGISHAEHAGLLERIFGFLREWGRVPDDWIGGQVRRIDRTDGDIDTLSKRLAYIRTWTYVAQRTGWVDDESHWRGATRAVEDRLSDALHGALTQRFVDRRTSVLLRRLKQKESLVAEVNDKGEVTVEGQFVGRLEGFRFRLDASATPEEGKTLRAAAVASLKPELHLRSDRFYNSPDTEIDFTEQGGLMWGENAVGKLAPGPEPLKPQVVPFVDEEAGPDVAQKVQRRLQHFIDRKIATLFEPLLAMGRDEALTGLARGFAFRLVENLGVIPRESIAAEVKELDQDARGGAAQARGAVRAVHGVPAAAAEARADAAEAGAVVPVEGVAGVSREPAAGSCYGSGAEGWPRGLRRDGGVSGDGRAGDPDRHAGAARRHAAAGEQPGRVRGEGRHAVDHGALARAVRASDGGAGLPGRAGRAGEGARGACGGGGACGRRRGPRCGGARGGDRGGGDAGARGRGARRGSGGFGCADRGERARGCGPAGDGARGRGADARADGRGAGAGCGGRARRDGGVLHLHLGGNRGRREQGERRGPRREGQGERPKREGQGDRPRREAGGERPQGGKPRGDRPWEDKGDRGGKGKGPKGKRPPREEGPRTFEARPQRKDRIDPDNPFAAALMGFRPKE